MEDSQYLRIHSVSTVDRVTADELFFFVGTYLILHGFF